MLGPQALQHTCQRLPAPACPKSGFRAARSPRQISDKAVAPQSTCRGRKNVPRAVAEAEVLPATGSEETAEIGVTRQDLGDSRVRLRITVPQPAVKNFWDQAVAAHEGKASKGLPPKKQARPGRVKGRAEIKTAVVEQLGDLALREGIAAAGLGNRVIEDTLEYGETSDLDPEQPFSFSVEFDLAPEVRWRIPYSELEVGLTETDEARVPELVETELQARLREAGSMQVVQGRGFQQGDVAVVDFSAATEAGQEVPGLRRPKMRVDSSKPSEMPGLVEGLLGLQAGQERDFQVPAPEGDGQLNCHVKLTELLSVQSAELTDEWVQQTFAREGIQTVADLREQLQSGAAIAQYEAAEQFNEQAIATAISDAVEMDLPETLVLDNARRSFEAQLAQLAERLPREQMEKVATEQALTYYLQQRRPEIEASLRAVFGLSEIAAGEGLQLDEEEFEQAVKLAVEQGATDSEDLRANLQQSLLDKRAMVWLAENGKNVTRELLPLQVGRQ